MKKVAFVTGGSRGIGLGIAQHLAKNGFNLAINGMRSEELVTETLTALRLLGAEVIYCQGDIASKEAREQMLDKIKTHFGRLNVLVNNAGVAPKERNDLLAATEESFDYVVSTNLKGTYFLTQAAAKKPSVAWRWGHSLRNVPTGGASGWTSPDGAGEQRLAALGTLSLSSSCAKFKGTKSGLAALKACAINSFSSGKTLQVAYTKRPPDLTMREALCRMACCFSVNSCTAWGF
jgi:NAD(P)-dependent dehydrogenase (short-subunit alcohol dehydrogenase family)